MSSLHKMTNPLYTFLGLAVPVFNRFQPCLASAVRCILRLVPPGCEPTSWPANPWWQPGTLPSMPKNDPPIFIIKDWIKFSWIDWKSYGVQTAQELWYGQPFVDLFLLQILDFNVQVCLARWVLTWIQIVTVCQKFPPSPKLVALIHGVKVQAAILQLDCCHSHLHGFYESMGCSGNFRVPLLV